MRFDFCPSLSCLPCSRFCPVASRGAPETKGNFSIDDDDRNEVVKIAIRLLSKTTTLHVQHTERNNLSFEVLCLAFANSARPLTARDAIYGLSLLLVLQYPCPKRFLSQYSGFPVPSPQNPTFPNPNSIRRRRRLTTRDLFIYFTPKYFTKRPSNPFILSRKITVDKEQSSRKD